MNASGSEEEDFSKFQKTSIVDPNQKFKRNPMSEENKSDPLYVDDDLMAGIVNAADNL
jgi:hypothetical protein